MTMLAALAVAGCLAVGAGSEHIMLGDLAPAFPGLPTALPDAAVAFAPAPGVQRVFRVPELRRLAARWNLAADPAGELCFERPAAPLDPARLREAMLQSLPLARIEILDYSRVPAPDGRLEFPPGGLRQTTAGGLWNGSVRYGADRRFPVWARVKVTLAAPRVVAARDLTSGRRIDAAELRLETGDGFPSDNAFARSVEEIAGRVLRRPVRAGDALRTTWLDPPKEVAPGDTVRVEVRCGGALLEMEAQAEAAGSIGQTISVRNTVSKKCFRARVEGKGRVSVGL